MTTEEFIAELFGNTEIQLKSGVNHSSESSFLVSAQEIASELAKRFNHTAEPTAIEQTINKNNIEVFGPTGYGPSSRLLQVVNFGQGLFGLNTENNVRETLRRYFCRYQYLASFEFDDGDQNAVTLSKPSFAIAEIKHNRYGRDLLALKLLDQHRDIWLVELKGHSGIEDWDFFGGLKQLLRLIRMKDRISYFSQLQGYCKVTVKCAYAFPNHNVKAHEGRPCYAKEVERLKEIFDNNAAFDYYSKRKTYRYVTEAIEDYSIKSLVFQLAPVVYFLMVRGIDSVTDCFTGNQLSNFLV